MRTFPRIISPPLPAGLAMELQTNDIKAWERGLLRQDSVAKCVTAQLGQSESHWMPCLFALSTAVLPQKVELSLP